MREKVFQKTKLTCSAGIAPNSILAKIASDEKKPNGQVRNKASSVSFVAHFATVTASNTVRFALARRSASSKPVIPTSCIF